MGALYRLTRVFFTTTGVGGYEVTKCTGVETLCLPPLWVKISRRRRRNRSVRSGFWSSRYIWSVESWTRRAGARGAAQAVRVWPVVSFVYHGHTGEQDLMTHSRAGRRLVFITDEDPVPGTKARATVNGGTGGVLPFELQGPYVP